VTTVHDDRVGHPVELVVEGGELVTVARGSSTRDSPGRPGPELAVRETAERRRQRLIRPPDNTG
jgi:hypothetical protein